MRFPGIRLVEQSEQKFRRIRDGLEEKQKNPFISAFFDHWKTKTDSR